MSDHAESNLRSRAARGRYHDAVVQREIRRLAHAHADRQGRSGRSTADELTTTDSRHRGAVVDAEARRLARTLTRYGVLTSRRLFELSGADRWTSGRFSVAVARAVERGLIRELGFGFYAPPPAGSAAESHQGGAPKT